MNTVFVSHAKNDKNFAKKIVSKLESSGIKCFVSSRDKSSGGINLIIEKSNIFILILSKNAQTSREVVEQLKIAVDNNCHIIPVKTEKIDTDNIGIQYFLHTLEWVDVHEDGFNEAYEILLEIIEEISGKKIEKQKNKNNIQKSENDFNIKKSHLLIVVGLLSLAVFYLLFFNNDKKTETVSESNNNVISNNIVTQTPNYELKTEEKDIVGVWKMIDYEDSRVLTGEEKRLTEQNIENMKKNVLLNFKADKTFERSGFTPKVQQGLWEYSSKKRKIYLTPMNSNKKEEINILSLTNSKMVFVVTELINAGSNSETVTTKITFKKQ